MREGWEYKKLGEVCELKSGYTPKKEELSTKGLYPYYKVADMNTLGNDVYLDITSSYKIDARKFYPKGAIAFPKNGAAVSTNKKRILRYDSIVDLNTAVAIFNNNINEKFAYYWFVDTDFKNFVRGGALPTLDMKSLKDKPFPSIDKPTQLSIVSELDKINELIRLKKEQLTDYDKLTQSLFYQMFGDPVENEMGWEVKRLGEVCTAQNGLVDPKIEPYANMYHVGPANIISNTGDLINLKLAKEENLISGKYLFKSGMILYSKIRPNLNKVIKATFDGICSADMYPLIPNKNILSDFLLFNLKTRNFLEYAISHSGRANIPKINREALMKYNIPLPPLPLQQLFARRIEQIEHQKAEVQKAITDLETLLASRMQYWFE